MNVLHDISKEQKLYLIAVIAQGLLASESEEYGHFHETRIDPNTGKTTFRKEVYPLRPDGQEDYTKKQIETKVERTAYQNIAEESFRVLVALAERLEQ